MFFESFIDLEVDEQLVSGLLAALNQFIFSQFDQPIESIDMAGYRWIYSTIEEYDVIFVGADTKDVSSEILRARLNVIKETFFSEYIKSKEHWKSWNDNLDVFKPFKQVIHQFYNQWVQAENFADSALFFDFLGVFQQLLNLLKKVIDKCVKSDSQDLIYKKIEIFFTEFKINEDIAQDSEISKFSFSRYTGFNIIGIDPINCDIQKVKNEIKLLLRNIVIFLKNILGRDSCFIFFDKMKLYDYILRNIVLLKNLNIDEHIFKLFLLR